MKNTSLSKSQNTKINNRANLLLRIRVYWHNLFSGRLSRRNYLFAPLIVMLPYGLIVGTYVTVGLPESFAWVITAPGIFISFVWLFSLPIRRFHDTNQSGWMSLWAFFPLINIFLGLYLLIASPKDKDNRYGEYDDRKFSLKKIFGLTK